MRLILPALALVAGLTCPAGAGDRPARPRLCPEDAPEGVRLPPRPGCGARETAQRQDSGFHDLGDGTRIGVSGRAGVVYDLRR